MALDMLYVKIDIADSHKCWTLLSTVIKIERMYRIISTSVYQV